MAKPTGSISMESIIQQLNADAAAATLPHLQMAHGRPNQKVGANRLLFRVFLLHISVMSDPNS